MFLSVTLASLLAVSVPDASTGEIDGKVAIMVSPITRSREPIDPAGCEVHVAADGGRGSVTRVPCSHWFLPGPPGRYLLWLEQGNTISVVPAVVLFGEMSFREHGRGAPSTHVMVPAGFVTVDAPTVRGEASLRLMSIEREPRLSPFERRVAVGDARNGHVVRMPAGPLLSALVDKDGNALALGRPVDVVAGERVRVSPTPPKAGEGAVLFSLQRPRGAYTDDSIVLVQGDRVIEPDVLHQSSERVVAIWYSVRPAPAFLRFSGAGLPEGSRPVAVSGGRVSTIRESLARQEGR